MVDVNVNGVNGQMLMANYEGGRPTSCP